MKKINKELLANTTILYVEDELMIREEVEYFLKMYTKKIYTAKNGIEGIEQYKKVNPDVIITDIQMPKMNGLKMLENLDLKGTPVIITTAHSDIEFFLKAIELKVEKFVIKPMNLADLLHTIQDCIVNNNLKNKLFEKENLLKIVDENVLLSITDNDGVIVDASYAYCKLVGYEKDELIGATHNILKHEDTPDSFYKNMWKHIGQGKVFKCEIKNRKKSGEIYWVKLTITPVFKENIIVNYAALRQNITNRKKIEALSIVDEMTQLYNRRYFNKVLEKEIIRCKTEEKFLSLVSIDIDYFKKYNDTYGHPKGDEVLISVAKTLKEHFSRVGEYVFRMGGEEFSIIAIGDNIEESFNYTQQAVEKIEALKIPHENSKCSKFTTISAGVVICSSSNIKSFSTLYNYSDQALYEAKRSGRNKTVLSCESE